jgi:hypothetical protein
MMIRNRDGIGVRKMTLNSISLNEFKKGQGNRGRISAFLLSRPEAVEFVQNFPNILNSVHISGYVLLPPVNRFDGVGVEFKFSIPDTSRNIILKNLGSKIIFSEINVVPLLFNPIESILIEKYFGKPGGTPSFNCRVSTLHLSSRMIDVVADNHDLKTMIFKFHKRISREAKSITSSESFKNEFIELKEKSLCEGLVEQIRDFVSETDMDLKSVDRAFDEFRALQIVDR